MTDEDSGISGNFNERADKFPQTDFVNYLRFMPGGSYGDETTKAILDVFQKLGLPPPRGKKEYMTGNEGGLVFLERYGLVLRIERKELMEHYGGANSGSPWISKPLASIDAGKATISLCPGYQVATWKNEAQQLLLRGQLRQQGILFWDNQPANFGFMPARTASFPDGVPVVIDRGAVAKLTDDIAPVKSALGKEAAKAEEYLYGPLREALDNAWPDKSAPANATEIKKFWALCADYKREGKLVAGWRMDEGSFSKTGRAAATASAYETRLQSMDAPAAPAAAAPRKPR